MHTYPKIETLFRRDERHRITDELRRPVIGTISKWRATEKVDGTNIRVHLTHDGNRVTSEIGGRTDRAQIPAPLVEHLRHLDLDAATAIMEDHSLPAMTLFGEGYGPGIQKGGNYRHDQGFILFDVQVGDLWLADDAVTETADRLGIPRVPDLGIMSLDDIIDMVRDGFSSLCAIRDQPAEGIVARPLEPLYDQRGERLIVKVKTKDFRQ